MPQVSLLDDEQKAKIRNYESLQQFAMMVAFMFVALAFFMTPVTISLTKSFILWSGIDPTFGFQIVAMPIIIPLIGWWLAVQICDHKINKIRNPA